ncbi:uncharacterized protein DSM5745_04520 [Aspergillus mulundensis]|uniref:Uncharacterized protein n=1 Tax=Aspergillus mulundensis TaxID=1810919 RepID=A0A3D8SDL5_9EURO|nr:Uncharacterized protein DSM5745_04520 [Aspergillus mulundensis]RDW84194.1 Uncharacterized protein DSM5745_04520 [Aspergillus mulundensis]
MDVLPPSIDPWYTAPAGYEAAVPGTVLRVRPGPETHLAAMNSTASSIYNILYRTTDAFEQPSFAVTTLLVPLSPSETNGTKLLSYQIPYNTVNIDYSPSYALGTEYATYLADITTALENGWFVNVPDFEGPRASFSVSLESAHATLDSIRAVIAADIHPEHGLDADTSTVLWGYSGGSIPSEVAGEVAAAYAPELDIAGIAIGGVLVDVEHVLRVVDGTAYAALAPLMMLGLATRYPEVRAYLDSYLRPYGAWNRTAFESAAGMSVLQAYGVFGNQSMAMYFSSGSGWLHALELRAAKEESWVMGRRGTPGVPMFVYMAVGDEVCPVGDVDGLVRAYCEAGARIRYERNTVGNHLAEKMGDRERVFGWLAGIFEGMEVQVGCVVRDVKIGGEPVV